MFRFTRLGLIVASLFLCAALLAQTQPATNIALPAGAITVTIKAVKGIVQYRTSADAKWEKAVEGTELSEGAELRTGPRSAVQFMPDLRLDHQARHRHHGIRVAWLYRLSTACGSERLRPAIAHVRQQSMPGGPW